MQIEITPDYLLSQGLSENFHERFWSKVDKRGPIPAHVPELGNCWTWKAALSRCGYGCIARGGGAKTPRSGRVVIASRASWIVNFGPIPPGLLVLHKCDNISCVRPFHLFVGTNQDNMDDMIKKGRNKNPGVRGARNSSCKISYESICEMRELYSSGRKTIPEISREFCHSTRYIRSVINLEYRANE